jgi:hypothetical protein
MSMLTDAMKEKIRGLFPRYPSKQAVTLPALHMVQDEFRCVPMKAVEEIGELLELSPNTAAGRYRYGLQKLRACLNGENYESLESAGEATAFLGAARTVAEP